MADDDAIAVEIGKSDAVDRLARTTRRVVKVVAILLPAVVAGLSLRDVTVQTVVDVLTRSNEVVWRVAILLYFASLVFGAYSDIDDQARVFRVAPRMGQLPLPAIAIILMLGIIGGIVAYSWSFEVFAIALTAFWVVWILGWKFMVGAVTAPMVGDSRAIYTRNNDYAGIERTRVVEDFLAGRWHIARFLAGGAILLMLLGLSLARHQNIAALPIVGALNWETLKAFGLLFFVLVMESWIWAKRIKMKALLMGLDQLARRYRFTPA